MTQDNEHYRAGFEAWAESFGYDITMTDSGYMAGEYADDDTRYAFQGYCQAKCEASTAQQGRVAPVDDYLLLGYATNSSVARLRERMSVGADGLTTSIRAQPYNKCTVAIYALVSQQSSVVSGTPSKREASTEPSAIRDAALDEATNICEETALKWQQHDGTYAAGKKAGALESAELIRAVKTVTGAPPDDAEARYSAYVAKCQASGILPCSEEAFRDDAKDAVIAAARKLVQCKGRYHSELNLKALAAAVEAHTKAGSGS